MFNITKRDKSGGHLMGMLIITVMSCYGCSGTKTGGIANTAEQQMLPQNIAGNYKLIWQDEFNEDTLDCSKWNYRAEGTTRQYGFVSRNTISLDGNGHLVIQVTQDSSGKYYIGEVGTEGLFATTYGFFQCRAKMNTQIGPHVAFWLQSPTMGKTNDNPAKNGTEIDVFEYHKRTPDSVHHNIHWNGYGDFHKHVGVTKFVPGMDTGFHTFGLLWTKDSYTFYVDGQQTWRTDKGISKRNEYIILSTELTGWGGNPEKGHFPDSVVYDYVRVYKKE